MLHTIPILVETHCYNPRVPVSSDQVYQRDGLVRQLYVIVGHTIIWNVDCLRRMASLHTRSYHPRTRTFELRRLHIVSGVELYTYRINFSTALDLRERKRPLLLFLRPESGSGKVPSSLTHYLFLRKLAHPDCFLYPLTPYAKLSTA